MLSLILGSVRVGCHGIKIDPCCFGLTQEKFGVHSIRNNTDELTAAVYLQVSIVSQALIFVTRSRSWSFIERPGILLLSAFLAAQLVSALCLLSQSNA